MPGEFLGPFRLRAPFESFEPSGSFESLEPLGYRGARGPDEPDESSAPPTAPADGSRDVSTSLLNGKGTGMTDVSSFSSGSSGRFGPPWPTGSHSVDSIQGGTEPGPPGDAESPRPEAGRGDQPADSNSENDRPEPNEQQQGPDDSSASGQEAEPTVLPVFVDDPIVPLRLRLPGTIRHTLYHPGWYGIEENEQSQAFLGIPGEVLYGFEKLTHLVDYMRTGTPTGLAPGPDLAAVRGWTAEEYAKRLCDYDMVSIPELANGELSGDELGSIGSMLAVGLDLLDFLRIDGEHVDALRQDEDISKLAAGDEVLSIFAAGRHRHHVVEMIDTHWGPCMAAITARTTAPRAES